MAVPTASGGGKTSKSSKRKGKGPSRSQQRIKGGQADGDGGGGGSINYVPTDSLIAVTCLPVYSRNKISNKFNLKSFAAGKLTNDGFI